MKIYYLIVCTIFLLSCGNMENEIVSQEREESFLTSQNDNFKGELPENLKSEVYSFVTKRNEYNLEDLDVFYRREVPLHKGYIYVNNLKSLLISTLIDNYNLAENDDKMLISYYLEEIGKMENSFLVLEDMPNLLNQMGGVWNNEKIVSFGRKLFDKNQKHLDSVIPSNQTEVIARLESKLNTFEVWLKNKEALQALD